MFDIDQLLRIRSCLKSPFILTTNTTLIAVVFFCLAGPIKDVIDHVYQHIPTLCCLK